MDDNTLPSTNASRTVLVIDDDLDMQRMVARAITLAGFRPACTADARGGLRLFHELRPAMAFLDLMLPDLSGLEICRRLRAEGTATPLVAISTRDSPEDEANVMAAGFNLFIHKPMRLELVRRTVARFLGPAPGGP
ncbi:MAG: response regulator [Deltaproteobacteria bacterium]|nr:response regulator [Deltaproteobacteria bacterium]